MIRSIVIAFLIVFFLFLIGQGNVVNKTIEYTKEQAEFTQKHGLKGMLEKLWCGDINCDKTQAVKPEKTDVKP